MDFDKIWQDQKEFNAKLMDSDKVAQDQEEFRKWNNFYCLALHREVSEVLDTVDWKIHRKEHKPVIKSNTLEEIVDCLKYWMCLAQLHGFTAEDIEREYFRKSSVVEQRHKQEIRDVIANSGKKVVGVDIDGVLADYPRSFVDFMAKELGVDFKVEQVKSYSIYDCLGISTETGMKLKDKYRQTGQKRFIPLCEGAREFLYWLKDRGYAIVLLTARPYHQYKRIFSDTMEWLKNNDLPYDAIIFDEKKEEALINQFGGDKIEFFVEDVSSNAKNISKLGVPCYLITRPYNEGDRLTGTIKRVNSLQEVINDVEKNSMLDQSQEG